MIQISNDLLQHFIQFKIQKNSLSIFKSINITPEMAERDDFTHLIWDDESNLDNLIETIGIMIMASSFRNNIRYPEDITGKNK